MSGLDLYALLDRTRAQAADQMHEACRTLLPMLGAELSVFAAAAIDPPLRHLLDEAAEALVDELDARCRMATSVVNEMHFRLLQSEAPERRHAARAALQGRRADGFVLLPDCSDSEQLIAERVGEGIASAFGAAYAGYLQRLRQLSGRAAEDRVQPLGARGQVLALVAACRPYAAAGRLSPYFESALSRVGSVPVASLLTQVDAGLHRAGIDVMSPLLKIPPRAAFPVANVAAPGSAGRGMQPLRSPTDSGSDGPSPQRPDATPSETADPPPAQGRNQQQQQRPERPGAADRNGSGAAGPDVVGQRVNLVARAVESVNAARLAGRLGHNSLAARSDTDGNFRLADRLPTTDSLDQDARVFADRYAVPAFSTQARQAYFRELRGQMRAAGADPAQLMAVDLVTAMFDYTLDDRRLPDSIRPLLWRLQQPSVVLAALDPGYLGDNDRSIRSLVENLVAVAIAFPDQLHPGHTLHARLATVVRAVEVVAHAFHVRSRVLSEQVDREYRRASVSMSQLVSRLQRDRQGPDGRGNRRNRRDYRRRPSRELEVEVTRRVERFVSGRLRDRNLPTTVVDFLSDAWVRHMRTAALRDGEDSSRYQAAAHVVDDLLWTIDGHGQRRSRTELIARIPTIIRLLTRGVDEIGAQNDEFRTFFDELFVIHLRRMQRGGRVIDAVSSASSREAAPRADGTAAFPQTEPGADPAARGSAAVTQPEVPQPDSDESGADQRGVDSSAAAPGKALDTAAPVSHPPRPVAGVEPDPESSVAAPGQPSADTDATDLGAPGARQPGLAAELSANDELAGMDAGQATGGDALSRDRQVDSEMRLRRLVEQTTIDDVPLEPVRVEMTADQLGNALEPGQWLELVSGTGQRSLAKVAWMNERRTVALLLQSPDRLILSRHVAALIERAARGRVFRVR